MKPCDAKNMKHLSEKMTRQIVQIFALIAALIADGTLFIYFYFNLDSLGWLLWGCAVMAHIMVSIAK